MEEYKIAKYIFKTLSKSQSENKNTYAMRQSNPLYIHTQHCVKLDK